jgi:selenocysteine lyase/cysteine desulfurase
MNWQSNRAEALASQQAMFSIPDDVSYLNCAYMSPLSNAVIAAGQKGLVAKARPYEIFSDHFFEPVDQLKKDFAKLIDCDNPGRVVIMPSASYGFSIVARNLPIQRGQNIVIVEEQFPSNVYCWRQLSKEQSVEIRTIAPTATNRARDWNQRILEAIDEQTAMVSIGILHWADGTVFNLQEIRDRTNQVGAKLVLDGTQAIGAMPFSIASVDPDALICAAYKWLMGPYSIALGYFGPVFDSGRPLEENWINRVNSNDFAAQVGYQDAYRPYATRYDMGEKSNFILIPMLITAISEVGNWGTERIQSYCHSICKESLVQLQDQGFYLPPDDYRANHLFGIRPPEGYNWEPVKQALTEEKVYVSFRGSALRISPHVYNSKQDLNKLTDCLIQGLS